MKRIALVFLLIATAALGELPPANGLAKPLYFFQDSNSTPGPLLLQIVLDERRLYLYRNRRLIGFSFISAGRPGHSTPTGVFHVLEKRPYTESSLYGSWLNPLTGLVYRVDVQGNWPCPPSLIYRGAPMPFFQRLTNDGVSLHAGTVPPYHASHGCVRVPPAFAEILFSLTEIGTEVDIYPTRPLPSSLASVGNNPNQGGLH